MRNMPRRENDTILRRIEKVNSNIHCILMAIFTN